jgi:hypothetical protein
MPEQKFLLAVPMLFLALGHLIVKASMLGLPSLRKPDVFRIALAWRHQEPQTG